MKDRWGWIVAGAFVALGVVLVIWYQLRGDRTAARKAAVDMMVEWHAKDIATKKARVKELQKDFDANEVKIRELEGTLYTKKKELGRQFESAGLNANEIAERFRRIAV